MIQIIVYTRSYGQYQEEGIELVNFNTSCVNMVNQENGYGKIRKIER